MNSITIIVLVLLFIRFFGQIIGLFFSQDIYYLISFSFFALLYLVSIIGIFLKKKWSIVLTISLAIIDALVAFYDGGSVGLGAGIFDLILLILAYDMYKKKKF